MPAGPRCAPELWSLGPFPPLAIGPGEPRVPAALVDAVAWQLSAPTVLMDSAGAALDGPGAHAALYLPADAAGYDQAAACLLDWAAGGDSQAELAVEHPVLLGAGLTEAKIQACLAAMSRHGVGCDLYLLALEPAHHNAWSRADVFSATLSHWGTRICGRLAEVGMVGHHSPQSGGPRGAPCWGYSRYGTPASPPGVGASHKSGRRTTRPPCMYWHRPRPRLWPLPR